MDSWLLWNLTGGAVHACDATNASRTQIFNLHTLAWDPELLAAFDLPAAALPRVLPSSGVLGTTVPLGELPGGLPVAGQVGDSPGALVGPGRFSPGAIKATYGTALPSWPPPLRP
jgi:glycerol kinase